MCFQSPITLPLVTKMTITSSNDNRQSLLLILGKESHALGILGDQSVEWQSLNGRARGQAGLGDSFKGVLKMANIMTLGSACIAWTVAWKPSLAS